jgi:hypothetical protein
MVVRGMASRQADADLAFADAAVAPFDVPGIGLDARDPSRERVVELVGQHRDVVQSTTRRRVLIDLPPDQERSHRLSTCSRRRMRC